MSIDGRNINFSLALRYLNTKKKQSILVVLSVAFGVSAFIIMINFMTGVNDFLNAAIFDGSPDVVISEKPKLVPIKERTENFNFNLNGLSYIETIDKTLSSNKNITSYSKQLISPVIFTSNYAQIPGVLNGIIPKQESAQYNLKRVLKKGTGFESLDLNKTGLLLGISLAKHLKVTVGDTLNVITPNGNEDNFIVQGIFSFGITTIDNVRSYVHFNTLNTLLDKDNVVSHINLKLKNRHQLEIANTLKQQFNQIEVSHWKQNNKTIVIGNKVRDVLTWSVSFALLLVAGLGIYNVMNIGVLQKTKDISLLKILGYTKTNIIRVFIYQSLIIGVVGTIIGCILAFIICYLISITSVDTSDFLIIDTYPMNFNPLYYFMGFVFGISTALIAGYFPSKKASNVVAVSLLKTH